MKKVRSNRKNPNFIARKRERRVRKAAQKAAANTAARLSARTPTSSSFVSSAFYTVESSTHPGIRAPRVADNNQMQPGLRLDKGPTPPADFGLSRKFQDHINFRPPLVGRDEIDADPGKAFVRMRRAIDVRSEQGRDNCFVAYNRNQYAGPAIEVDPQVAQVFWEARLEETWQPKIDFIKSGPIIWKSLDIKTSPEATPFFLRLKKPDEQVSEAFNAALLTAANTSPVIPDWEMIILAIATFVHSHPAFADLVEDGEFYQPFGENTGWKLLKKPVLA